MATSSDQAKSEVENETPIHQGAISRVREASIGKVNGEPLGAPLYLTAAELRDLGADLTGDRVAFFVEGGELRIE